LPDDNHDNYTPWSYFTAAEKYLLDLLHERDANPHIQLFY